MHTYIQAVDATMRAPQHKAALKGALRPLWYGTGRGRAGLALCFALVLLGMVILQALGPVQALAAQATRQPLLLEGKKTLFQRVVSHPGAVLRSAPAPDAPVIKDKVKTFTAFYVYARQGSMVEVGVSAGKADGWMEAASTTFWPQAMTMVLTDRMGRQPVLFFKDRASLEKVCTDEQLDKTMRTLAETVASKNTLPADFPVIAAEPADTAISEKNFYLLPVLETDAPFGDKVRLVRVASINPGISDADSAADKADGGIKDTTLRSGIVFVIDTTISMGPYIEQTLKLVRSIYNKLEKSPHGDKVAFAVVAFRSNLQKAPGLEYTAKVICDFKTVAQRHELETALSGVKEASVSSHAFAEDSFAGVKEAVDKLSWGQLGSRALLLVSDAGPLLAGDPTSQTRFSPMVLADYLRTNKIYMTVLHVKSPSGKANHESAKDAYMEAARQADNQSSYVPLEAPNTAQGTKSFDAAGRLLAEGYEKLITATAEGRMLPQPVKQAAKKTSPEEEAARIAESTGYAMQLQFLGTKAKVTAPHVVDAWIADADLERLGSDAQAAPVLAARPAVLLTKTQLSQLREQVAVVLETARKSFLTDDSKNFFQSILSAAAHLARDPNSFSHKPGQNLAQTGLLGEFLEGLPYTSVVMKLTEDDWYNMSTGDQKKFIDHLEACIRRYEEFDRDNTHWEGFGSTNRNEWVYRVPLDLLP